MKVILNQLAAGPDGIYEPGSVYECGEDVGNALLKAGQATEIKKAAKIADAAAAIETAALAPEETATTTAKFRK